MALENKYANADLAANKLANPSLSLYGQLFKSLTIEEILAADAVNSVYRMMKGVDPNLILSKLRFSCDAFGAGGLIRIGLYESKIGGLTFDDDAFVSDLDVSATLEDANGLAAIDLADRQKKIFELAGHTEATKQESYDIAVKITVKGATGLGSILLDTEFLEGGVQ